MSAQGYIVRTNVRTEERDLNTYNWNSHVWPNASNCPSNHLYADIVLGALKKLFSSFLCLTASSILHVEFYTTHAALYCTCSVAHCSHPMFQIPAACMPLLRHHYSSHHRILSPSRPRDRSQPVLQRVWNRPEFLSNSLRIEDLQFDENSDAEITFFMTGYESAWIKETSSWRSPSLLNKNNT